jgi:alpha-glucosidase
VSGDSPHWWHDAVGYVVYVQSFVDSDGDGLGDLAGITSRLPYLEELGVTLLWVTPFYPSPMNDGGYDVADFQGIDPRYGGFEAFDDLVAEAHQRGMRVILDLVPNHTSIAHPWFQRALAEPTGRHRNYYLWADPHPDGSPPNNWISFFGGSAWTADQLSGQNYLHLFLPSQPDLNWRNSNVRDEFDAIVGGWLERGVDGFRIDVAQGLVKDQALRSNPVLHPWDPSVDRNEQWAAFDHRYDILQTETLEIFERWKRLCTDHDAVLIGETHVDEPQRLAGLLSGGGLDAGFWFGPTAIEWDSQQIQSSIRSPVETLTDPRAIAWLTSSQDVARAASRFGGGDLGRRRALLLSTLLFCLPGIPFLYQGEELGLLDGVVSPSDKLDPVTSLVDAGRDGCRTPMPWHPGPGFGFSTSAETWLPHGGRTSADTVAEQAANDESWLNRYRRLVQLRHTHLGLRSPEPVEWIDLGDASVVAFCRPGILVVANTSGSSIPLPKTISKKVGAQGGDPVLFSTHPSKPTNAGDLTLEGEQAVVLRSA